jgi:hypothetical protein
MAAFLESVANRKPPRVDGVAGRAALAVALRIIEEMESHGRVVAATMASWRP